MAGFDYDAMQGVADELLEFFGGASQRTITYTTSETYNTTTLENVRAESTFTGWGVVTQYTQDEIDGTTIQRGDLKLVLQKTSRRPEVDNTVAIDGDDYRIISVDVVDPGGVDLVYKCQIRL